MNAAAYSTALPPAAITAAVVSGLVVALVLFFAGASAALRPPARRFKAAVAAGCVSLLVQWAALALAGSAMDALDLLAGAAVLVAAIIAGFVFWSLIVWGFTLNMLLVLSSRGRAETLEAWAALYTGGLSIQAITVDRATVLTGSGLASSDGTGTVVLNPAGRVVALAVRVLRFLYGLGSRA